MPDYNDLSGFPLMDDPQIDVGDTFADYDPSGAASIDAYSDAFNWGSIWDAITSPTAKALLSMGSGLYGLYESGQQKNMAKDLLAKGDPFGPYRQVYAAQLMSLLADPSSIEKDPNYQFQFQQGQQAVERGMAAKGYLGSGNEGIALTQYGQNFARGYLNDRVAQLSGLAGANIGPNQAAGANTYNQGIDTASAALASLGYGVTRGGASAGTPGSGPKAAGGEAAGIGQDLKTAGSIVSAGNKVAGAFGSGSDTAGQIGTGLGTWGNIIGGVEQGGAAGYAKAINGLSQYTTGASIPALGYVDAAQKLASGDAPGAAISAVSTAVPMAALGFAAAGLLNKGFLSDGSKDRNSAAFQQASRATRVVVPMGKAGMNMMVVPKADGSYALLNPQQWDDLAGSWYGATFSPDGNQADWQSKFSGFANQYLNQTPNLFPGYSFDSSTGKIMYRGQVVGNYSGG